MELPPPLRRPAFRSLWAAGLVSQAGDWLLFIALPVVVFDRTGSALQTALAFLAQLAPAIVCAPLAGRAADRAPRRMLLIGLAALQALSLTPLLFSAGLPVVYGVIAAQSVLAAFSEPAERSLLPALVDVSELASANALVGLAEALARLAGGPLGGVLLVAGGLRTVIVADIASFLAAVLLLVRLPPTSDRRRGIADGRAPDVARGFTAVLRRPRVRAAVLVSGVADISQGIFLVLFVVFVARRLGGGPGETGLLRGVQAIGALAAAGALAVLARRWSPIGLMGAAATAFGALSLTIWNLPSLTTSVIVYGGLFALAGAPAVAMVTGMVSHLQTAVADGERGRAFAALGMADGLGEAIGMAIAGTLTAVVGLDAVLDLQGALYLATGLVGVRWLARVTRRTSDLPGPGRSSAGSPTVHGDDTRPSRPVPSAPMG